MVTGSQHGLPLQAVKEVAATFGAVVGTSNLATKAQASKNSNIIARALHPLFSSLVLLCKYEMTAAKSAIVGITRSVCCPAKRCVITPANGWLSGCWWFDFAFYMAQ